MLGRVGGAVVAVLIAIVALMVVGSRPPEAVAAEMCAPTTLDDLFPPPSAPGPTVPSSPDGGVSPTTPSPAPSITPPVPATTGPAPADCAPFLYEMGWPLAGPGRPVSGFGADRDGGARHHQGNDIAADRLTPVLAVADGVVMKVTQQVGTEECCWLSIRHDDGWQSYYIHLNNDRWGTDDGMGLGVRADLVDGMEVGKGELIGWVGDSGNAEETVDHLHFELRTPTGEAVDPHASLLAASAAAIFADPEPDWPYGDDDGTAVEPLAAALLADGLFLPCPGSMTGFCPDQVAAPDLAAAIVGHVTGRMPPALEGSYQALPAPLDPDLALPRTLESAFGCAPIEDCLDFGLPETELARLAAWSRVDTMVNSVLAKGSMMERTPVVRLPSAQDAEAKLREEGLRDTCNPPLDGERLLTRADTLITLVAWLQGENPEPCRSAQRVS